jgi:hypothetical protein
MIVKTHPVPSVMATRASMVKFDTSLSRARDARLAEKHLDDVRAILRNSMASRANLEANTTEVENAHSRLKEGAKATGTS